MQPNDVHPTDNEKSPNPDVHPESQALWARYEKRNSRGVVFNRVGTGLLWLIVLAVLVVGLWIVAVR